MYFAKNIRYLRIKNNYTRDELAEEIEYNPYTVGLWERGQLEPGIRALKNISKLFKVSIEDLQEKDLNPDFNPEGRRVMHGRKIVKDSYWTHGYESR